MKSLNNKTFLLQQLPHSDWCSHSSVRPSWFFPISCCQIFSDTNPLGFFHAVWVGVFFIILHLLGLQMSLPVRRFCVRVALIRTELGRGRRLLWLCSSFRVAVEVFE